MEEGGFGLLLEPFQLPAERQTEGPSPAVISREQVERVAPGGVPERQKAHPCPSRGRLLVLQEIAA
jgi:hypothetical protein